MKKIILGILLIFISISTLFISIIPSLYSKNSSGKIKKEIKTNFSFLKNETSPYVLLYFGYVGCTTVCTPSLIELSEIYKELDKKKFSFYFVNLLEKVDKENVNIFAEFFNKDFKGVYLSKKEINEITTNLRVKVLPSIIDKYEINHSSFLYVLKKDDGFYKQIFIYTARPFNKEIIVDDLKKI